MTAPAQRAGAGSRAGRARMLVRGWAARLTYFVPPPLPAHYEPDLVATIKRVRRQTMTSPARLAALCDAVEHVEAAGVPGAIVECGVWRGGSMMAAALTLLRLERTDRELYLFDTFAGMTPPSGEDVDSPFDGYSLAKRWRRRSLGEGANAWGMAGLELVRRNMTSTGYPPGLIHYVEGPVEQTLPGHAPAAIALLRLDTDWYASTRHELEHLYPRLSRGGVLIIDDYGHYAGSRRAVEDYFEEHGDRPFMHRVDYTARAATKAFDDR